MAERRQEAPVVDLTAYRVAVHARDVLVGLLNSPPWLQSLDVETAGREVRIVVRLAYKTEEALVCTPRNVNDIPVVVRLGTAAVVR